MKSKLKHVLDVQWLGSFTGIAGALLLATNSKYSAYGWVFFTASNVAWITYAIRSNVKSILLMQSVFLATSLLGVVRWLF